MKRILFSSFAFFLFVSCNTNDDTLTTDLSLTGAWTLAHRTTVNSEGGHVYYFNDAPVDLFISSDSTAELSDPWINKYGVGHILESNNTVYIHFPDLYLNGYKLDYSYSNPDTLFVRYSREYPQACTHLFYKDKFVKVLN